MIFWKWLIFPIFCIQSRPNSLEDLPEISLDDLSQTAKNNQEVFMAGEQLLSLSKFLQGKTNSFAIEFWDVIKIHLEKDENNNVFDLRLKLNFGLENQSQKTASRFVENIKLNYDLDFENSVEMISGVFDFFDRKRDAILSQEKKSNFMPGDFIYEARLDLSHSNSSKYLYSDKIVAYKNDFVTKPLANFYARNLNQNSNKNSDFELDEILIQSEYILDIQETLISFQIREFADVERIQPNYDLNLAWFWYRTSNLTIGEAYEINLDHGIQHLVFPLTNQVTEQNWLKLNNQNDFDEMDIELLGRFYQFDEDFDKVRQEKMSLFFGLKSEVEDSNNMNVDSEIQLYEDYYEQVFLTETQDNENFYENDHLQNVDIQSKPEIIIEEEDDYEESDAIPFAHVTIPTNDQTKFSFESLKKSQNFMLNKNFLQHDNTIKIQYKLISRQDFPSSADHKWYDCHLDFYWNNDNDNKQNAHQIENKEQCLLELIATGTYDLDSNFGQIRSKYIWDTKNFDTTGNQVGRLELYFMDENEELVDVPVQLNFYDNRLKGIFEIYGFEVGLFYSIKKYNQFLLRYLNSSEHLFPKLQNWALQVYCSISFKQKSVNSVNCISQRCSTEQPSQFSQIFPD